MARTYSTVSVLSEEMPFAVKYSSKDVRRNVPLIKNSKGIGFSDWSNVFTSVESAYRRRSGEDFSRNMRWESQYHITSIDKDWAGVFC